MPSKQVSTFLSLDCNYGNIKCPFTSWLPDFDTFQGKTMFNYIYILKEKEKASSLLIQLTIKPSVKK